MKQEVSPVLTAVIVVVALVVIGVAGWFFVFREKVEPSPTTAPGAVAGQVDDPATTGAASPDQAGGVGATKPAVD